MEDLFTEIFQEVFSPINLDTLWEHRNSNLDLPPIETGFPIRATKNEAGSVIIELLLSSNMGYFYKPLALLQEDKIFFPNEFRKLAKDLDIKSFQFSGFKREIDILIGVFSLTSLMEAKKNTDIPEFNANGIKYEHVVAFDGTIQTFLKEEPSFHSVLPQLITTELDNKPLAGFKLTSDPPMIFATNHSKSWFEKAQKLRLLEILNPA